jgi:hypothetical protein
MLVLNSLVGILLIIPRSVIADEETERKVFLVKDSLKNSRRKFGNSNNVVRKAKKIDNLNRNLRSLFSKF